MEGTFLKTTTEVINQMMNKKWKSKPSRDTSPNQHFGEEECSAKLPEISVC